MKFVILLSAFALVGCQAEAPFAPTALPTLTTLLPTQALTVSVDGATLVVHSTARTVGEALAEAGIPLVGLDFSRPSEDEALPADGQIQIIRVKEIIETKTQPIPFSTTVSESSDLALGEEKTLQAGEDGILATRTRVRYENGAEVRRVIEGETIVKEAITQEIAKGVKVALSPADDNSPYPYWHAAQMYASWYSPCNTGAGKCSYGTASGARAGFGVVAVDYDYYPYLQGMRVYIAGYGAATIGDTGGGPIIESAFGVPRYQWIDLGYDDNNIGGLSGWVAVYFLEPAPAEIPYFLK
ncbi:MAG: G5 domain-containing protein [Anaerolineales bacterium]|nr:G5 domain-containing protein [Anaerolineales bacterium]